MWKVSSTQDDDQFTQELLRDTIASRPSHNPPSKLRLGAVRVSWFETEPGVAFIRTRGGTVDDRMVAETYTREWLRNVGIRQAQYTFHRKQKVAHWDDIMEKARRLLNSGNVTLLRNGAQNIVGYVVGDHGEYTSEISREDPNSQTITQWQCECPWDQFAWQRTRQWKKYEGRPCAHVLATYWQSQRTPLDEEAGDQMGLFDPGTAQAPPAPGGISGTPPVGTPQVPQLSIPGVAMPPTPAQAPTGPDIIPPQPGETVQPGVVSVPGARQPTPADPLQHPGGTFSSWNFTSAEFQNSDMVRLEEEEYGELQGHGGEGSYKLIPKGSIGEVMGQDQTTGWVDVNFAGPQAQAGELQPFSVRAWIEPNKLTPMPNVPKPGPFLRRKR